MNRFMKFLFNLSLILFLLLTACTTKSAPSPATAESPAKGHLVFKHTTVSLTFDDGSADNYSVREALAQNQLHATFYIVSGFTGTNGFMTEEQLHNLYADGNEIGGHTLDHTKLWNLSSADLKRQVCQDRLNLLALGFHVTSFAYPFGYYDEAAKQAVKECGYNNARIVADGPESIPPADPFALKAMPYIVPDTHLPKMIRYVTSVENNGGGWAIFIFHHVCDNCDKFAVAPQTFSDFADWLGTQQANGLVVKTVDEVVGGATQPGVRP